MQYKPHALRLAERLAPVHDPVTLTAATIGLQIGAGTLSAMSTIAGGNAAAELGVMQQQAAGARSKQLNQAAQESRASSQRQAFEQRREGRLLTSKLQARAAASGGGADDPTVVKLSEDIAGRSELGALTEMFKGENRARGLEGQAAAERFAGDMAIYEGEAKKKASKLSAAGTILSSAGSAFSTYRTGKYG